MLGHMRGSADNRKKSCVEYMKMRKRLYRQKKHLPLTFSDAIRFLFSKRKWERKLMVWFWMLLLKYSQETSEDDGTTVTDMMPDPQDDTREIFDYMSQYPVNYTTKGGPVPIPFGSRLVPYTGIIPAIFSRGAR